MFVDMCLCELKHSLIVKASSNKGKFLALSLSNPDTLHGTAFTALTTLDARELVLGY